MKIVVRVKLVADADTASVLGATLRACNEAANFVSRVAFEKGEFAKPGLQRLIYADLKQMGLGAQAAIRTIAKVVDAYATLRASIRAGNLGRPGSPRRVKAGSKPGTRPTSGLCRGCEPGTDVPAPRLGAVAELPGWCCSDCGRRFERSRPKLGRC